MVAGHIVYLIESALAPRDLDRWGIACLMENGFAVTVLECADLSFLHLEQDRSAYSGFAGFRLKRIESPRMLAEEAAELAGADLILCLCGTSGFTRGNLPIFRAVARAGRPWLTHSTNIYPGFNRFRAEQGRLGARLADIVKRLPNIDPVDSLIARLPRSWLGIPHADAILYSGARSVGLSRHAGPATRRIFVHSMDYDRFLRVAATASAPTGTVVFLDECLPYHRDLAGVNAEPPEDPDHYYGALRGLFDRVERELGLKVVIAASPRSDYESRPGLFGERTILKGQTDRLIAESSLVLAHRSTSITMAVMFRKPIMILATRRQARHWWHEIALAAYAEALGQSVQMIDDPAQVGLPRDLTVDDGIYDRFVADYIKMPGTRDEPFWPAAIATLKAEGLLPS